MPTWFTGSEAMPSIQSHAVPPEAVSSEALPPEALPAIEWDKFIKTGKLTTLCCMGYGCVII